MSSKTVDIDGPVDPAARRAALVLRGLRRYYPGTKALDWDESSEVVVEKGTIHGLLGENGAGKSTLLGVIAGLSSLSAGTLLLDGRPYAPTSVVDGRRHGVEIVLQEPGLVPSLTVAENFLLGRSSVASRFGVLVPGRTVRAVGDALGEIVAHVSPRALAGALSLEDRKLVEFARAIHFRPAVLLVDEMSACLGHTKLKILFDALHRLKEQGVAIVYISHYLDEIHRLCDRVSVLKDGRLISTLTADTDPDTLTRLMVGRLPTASLYRADAAASTGGAEVLALRGLTRTGAFSGIDLTLHAGEILGVGGLVGCGSEQLGRVIFGDLRADTGQMQLDGRPYRPTGPRDAIRHGVAYVPPDRDREGVILRASVQQNVALPTLERRAHAGFYNGRRDGAIATRMVRELDIRARGGGDLPFHLSGGNRQKVVLAKWLVEPPRLLVLHNPTRGIDVGAKAEIYALMQRLVAAGTAILLLSDELPELIGMSDRIVVLRRGVLTHEASRDDRPTEEQLVTRMI